MRIHPAVASTMVVVGGLLLVSPLLIWAYLFRHVPPTESELPPPAMLFGMLSGLAGIILLVVAVLFSISSRGSDDPA